MPIINRMMPIPMTSVNSATLDPAVWTPLYVPFEAPISILIIVNDSIDSIFISFDGTTAHEFVSPRRTLKLDMQSNSLVPPKIANLSVSPGVFIKGNPSIGIIYCSGFTSFVM